MARLLVLALFFLGGVILGQVCSARVPDATGEELTRYLEGFLQVNGEGPGAVLAAAVLYFRYPLAAFLLGFASIGALLLPFVCCFTAAFGPEGVLLALAVFGLRCAVTLPGYFLLAVPAWEHSAALASLSFGRSRSPVVYGRAWWGRLAAVCVLLLAGMCAELMLSPRLVGLLAERLLAA